jgi:hypothetical protein
MQVLAVVGTIAAIALVLFGVQYMRRPASTAASPKATQAQTESVTPTGTGTGHPLAKYIEVTGVRFTEEKNRRFVRVLVVNHSAAELPDLKMQVRVSAADREIVSFPVNVPSMGPYESRDFISEVKIGLKPYEMPDWVMTRAGFEITEK